MAIWGNPEARAAGAAYGRLNPAFRMSPARIPQRPGQVPAFRWLVHVGISHNVVGASGEVEKVTEYRTQEVISSTNLTREEILERGEQQQSESYFARAGEYIDSQDVVITWATRR